MNNDKIEILSYHGVVSYLLFVTEKVNSDNKILSDSFILEIFEKCWECQNRMLTSNKLYDDYLENLLFIIDNPQKQTEKELNLLYSLLYMFYYLIWTIDGIERLENPEKPFWGSELGDIDDSFFENSLEFSLKSCDDIENEIIRREIIWNYLIKNYSINLVGLKGVILSKEYLQNVLMENQ
jgi:hypothetical protein